MSRCSRTDALLDATILGAGLSAAEADHATSCTECARAMASARRFDRELHSVGVEIAPEPMPPGMATATAGHTIRGGAPMSQRTALIGGITAAAVVAVFVGTAQWDSTEDGRAQRAAATDAETDQWVRSAREFVTRTEPDGGEAAGWTPVRVERCGRTGLAFFEATAPDGLPLYRWAMGRIDRGVPQATGEVRSVDDERVAGIRATLPPCEMVVDVVTAAVREIGMPRELWAVTTGEEDVEGEVRLVGATLMADGHRAGPNGEVELPTYLVLMDRRTDQAHWVERATISVTDGAWAAGRFVDLPVERPETQQSMQIFADPGFTDETLFAWIDDPDVRAVDIWVPREGRVLRYTVGSPGFVLQFDARVGPVDEMTYELLDAHGAILEAGSVAAWLDRARRN
jgi:hypothetical protein